MKDEPIESSGVGRPEVVPPFPPTVPPAGVVRMGAFFKYGLRPDRVLHGASGAFLLPLVREVVGHSIPAPDRGVGDQAILARGGGDLSGEDGGAPIVKSCCIGGDQYGTYLRKMFKPHGSREALLEDTQSEDVGDVGVPFGASEGGVVWQQGNG